MTTNAFDKTIQTLSRRTFVAGSLAAATAGVAHALDAPTVIRVGTPVGSVQGIKAAIEEGYFRDEGIAIQFVVLAGGPNILAGTVGGSIDVGYSDLFAWVGGLDNGFDLELIQSANGRGNSDYIIAGPNSGINSPQELRGKRIGVDAHAQSRLRVALYLQRFGLKASDAKLITVNQRDTVGAALFSGQLDAAIASDPDVAVWEHDYKVRPLEGHPWQQIPATATTAAFFVNPKWLAANPKLADSFVRIARKGATRFNSYSAVDKAKIYLKYDKIDLFALEKSTPGVIDRVNSDDAVHDGPVDIEATTKWLRIAADNGVIKSVIDLRSRLYPTALLPRV